MKKLVAAVLLMVLSITAACADTLHVAVYTDIAGFGVYNREADVWSGMEVDLARKLAEDLGYEEIEFIGVDTDSREDALKSGKADCAIALFSITEDRAKRLHFSPPYFSGGCRVMVETSTLFTRLKDLVNMNIGVTKGATAARALASTMARNSLIPEFDEANFDPATFNGGITFTLFNDYDTMIEALELGEIDGCCADDNILYAYQTDDRIMLNETMDLEKYGVATMPDDPLNEKIDELIRSYMRDGTMTSLIDKWQLTEVSQDADI